jgi:bifunctional non-homologous end joining protein LigD
MDKVMPTNIEPMRASAGKEPFSKPGWCFEFKLDGYRIIAFIENGKVKLQSRNLNDYTYRFPPIVADLLKWKRNAILDGEVVVFNDNDVSDLNELEKWGPGIDKPIYFFAFDLLWLDDKDYMNEPLYRRKSVLKHLLPKSHAVIYHDEMITYGIPTFRTAERAGMEGIVAKRVDSIYQPGKRSKDWLKIKCMKESEFVIAGYTKNDKGATQFSTLILGDYAGGKLQFVGEIGAGFSDNAIKDLMAKMRLVKKCPFTQEPHLCNRWKKKKPDIIAWCRPELTCCVRYLERNGGELRHASFKGITVSPLKCRMIF